MITDNRLLVVIAGPTASGKTTAGVEIADHFGTEIISADSRQFYQGMSIGTAVPAKADLERVKHHFIQHLPPDADYNISRFEEDALALIEKLFVRHRILVTVGGSGLYIDAVCRGMDVLPDPDPEIRRELKETLATHGIDALRDELRRLDPGFTEIADLSNPPRLIRALEVCRITGVPFSSLRSGTPKVRPFRILKIGLTLPREALNQRISNRVDTMMRSGLPEEVRGLLPLRHLNALQTVGYRELFEYLDGNCTLEYAVEKIKTNTRRYAKRQMTWFRRDAEMHWFNPSDYEGMIKLIETY